MIRVLLRAVAASLIVGIVVPAALFLTVHTAAIPKEGVQAPNDYYKWSLHDQNEWRLKNFEFVGGFAYIRERMKQPGAFAAEYAIAAGSTFAVGFASCLLFTFFGGLRSNNTFERDARKSGARPST
jgi:hypothetical protein